MAAPVKGALQGLVELLSQLWSALASSRLLLQPWFPLRRRKGAPSGLPANKAPNHFEGLPRAQFGAWRGHSKAPFADLALKGRLDLLHRLLLRGSLQMQPFLKRSKPPLPAPPRDGDHSAGFGTARRLPARGLRRALPVEFRLQAEFQHADLKVQVVGNDFDGIIFLLAIVIDVPCWTIAVAYFAVAVHLPLIPNGNHPAAF